VDKNPSPFDIAGPAAVLTGTPEAETGKYTVEHFQHRGICRPFIRGRNVDQK
jgi:hypothetical protein